MKGDFSRRTFDRAKHYAGVEMQQGRVQVDADWNEQGDIVRYRLDTETLDIIGPSGGPMFNAAFEIVNEAGLRVDEKASLKARGFDPLVANDIYLRTGRYYVDGILCENDTVIPLTGQPDLLGVTAPDPLKLHYSVYLDVWERHITALDDPRIREVALGGPDTATRRRTIWQVKLAQPASGATDNCLSPVASTPSTGLLTAMLAQPAQNADDCIVPQSAGYRSLENQLYRVEIHTPGVLGTATFKWSRENGSIVTTIQSADVLHPNVITVADLGRDELLGFRADDWVEITDDGTELSGLPGALYQIQSAPDAVARTITLNAAPAPAIDFTRNPKLRRWDQTTGNANGIKTSGSLGTTFDLEFGVQVAFSGGNGDDGQPRRYNTGDYWLIPARTATGDPLSGQLDWPTGPDKVSPAALPARGIHHHYARIATLDWASATSTWTITDCRRLFPPITALTSFFYLGGDGQEGEIDPLNPGALIPVPELFQVGVANGSFPVAGARVRFRVVAPSNGRLVNPVGGALAAQIDVWTGDGSAGHPKGIAAIAFRMDADVDAARRPLHPHQQVVATLLDANDQPVHLPITFTASLERNAPTLQYAGGDGQEAHRGLPLPAPLRVLVSDDWAVLPNQKVEFKVQSSAAQPGTLSLTRNAPQPQPQTQLVLTTTDGIAQCYWTPSANATDEPTTEWVVASLVDATTNAPIVGQGSIEFFCHDLSFHNRHLHGYGIVCGLQVYCGPNATGARREGVTVRNGYAIDSFGKDIIVQAAGETIVDDPITGRRVIRPDGERINIIQMVRDAGLVGDDGNPLTTGVVALSLKAALRPQDRYGVERYDPSKSSWADAFDDTFWSDVWKDCVKPILDDFKDELTAPASRGTLSTFLNIGLQAANPQTVSHVFISKKEDKILRDVYAKLRKWLTSNTFCALSDTALRPLPDYNSIYQPPVPAAPSQPSTIFGSTPRKRLRVHPSGPYAFALGDDDMIHVFNVTRETLELEVRFPTAGVTVKDVAVSANESQLFAIAVGTSGETLFATANLEKSDPIAVTWSGPAVTISQSSLVTMKYSPVLDQYYAVGLGTGLYRIDVTGKPAVQVAAFNAFGHLEMDTGSDASRAYVTVSDGNNQYLEILRFNLSKTQASQTGRYILPSPGSDDICLAAIDARTLNLFVVVNSMPPGVSHLPSAGQGSKVLLGLNPLADSTQFVIPPVSLGWTPAPNSSATVDTSAYRLSYDTARQFVLIASTEANVVKRYSVPPRGSTLEPDVIPVQIGPTAIASDPKRKAAYVANGVSTTITIVPTRFIDGTNKVLMEPLAAYHSGMLEAYFDATAVLAQHLKDCICDHLLVKCPDDTVKTLYLACIEIRDQQVYKICNFSKRKYVHTFPAVEYWLSVVPIIPLITKLVAEACCWPIVDALAGRQAPNAATRGDMVSASSAMRGVTAVRAFDWTGTIAPEIDRRVSMLRTMSKAFVTQPATPVVEVAAPSVVVPVTGLVGQPAAVVTNLLANERIQVAGTERLAFGTQTRDILLAPSAIKSTDAVTLVLDHQDNVVGYKLATRPIAMAALAMAAPAMATADAVPAALLADELAKRDARIGELTNTLNALQSTHAEALQARDAEVAALTKRVDAIAKAKPAKPK